MAGQGGSAEGEATAAILARLRARLPAAAIPSRIEACARFPLSASGKVDRKALAAALAQAPPQIAPQPEAPSLRETIRRAWAEVLEREVDDPSRTFFDLGGTSLSLIDLHTRLQERLGRRFDIATLFAAPRIADLERALAPATADAAQGAVAARREAMAALRAGRGARA